MSKRTRDHNSRQAIPTAQAPNNPSTLPSASKEAA
jgi:hypothetical protein